jgi:hypothetical protein
MSDVPLLCSPTWRTPAQFRRGTDRMETIELKRLEMERAIWNYRAFVGPQSVRKEVTRILEEAA